MLEELAGPLAFSLLSGERSSQHRDRATLRAGDGRERMLHGASTGALADLLETDFLYLDPVTPQSQGGELGIGALRVCASGHGWGLHRVTGGQSIVAFLGASRDEAAPGETNLDNVEYVCAVCDHLIEPDPRGKVRLEGVTHQKAPKAWVWGPVPVHEDCRLTLHTPYDDQVGFDYIRTWQKMTA